MLAIIPCSGYGTRVGMQPWEAKELLLDKSSFGYGKPLIDYTLNICKEYNFSPLVTVRAEKKDLIAYLIERNITHLIEDSADGKWYNSVLKTQHLWETDNLLLLPDTRFLPRFQVMDHLRLGMSLGNNAVFAMHRVDNPSQWGVITADGVLIEKPQHLTGAHYAWGLIAFKKTYGQWLFSRMAHPIKLVDCGFTKLSRFIDVTRTPSL